MDGGPVLIGTFAPVPGAAGFELPVFRFPSGNITLVQDLDERGNVLRLIERDFSRLDDNVPGNVTTEADRPGIYAFRCPDKSLHVGTRERLGDTLAPMIEAGDFDDRPTMRFRLSAFFELNHRVADDAQAAWSWLEATASRWTADTWKLESTIVPEVRRAVGMRLRDAGEAEDVIKQVCAGVNVAINGDELDATVELSSEAVWAARCRFFLQDNSFQGDAAKWWTEFSNVRETVNFKVVAGDSDNILGDTGSILEQAKAFLNNRLFLPLIENSSTPTKIKNRMKSVRVWVSKFPKIGDLVAYMERFPKKNIHQLPLGLPVSKMEDVYEEFMRRFSVFRNHSWSLDDFKEGESYSGYMVAIYSKIYNNRRGGIYPVGRIGEHTSVLIKALIGGGEYENKWIANNLRLKYYLRGEKGVGGKIYSEEIPENRSVVGFPGIPVLVFSKNSEGDSLYTYHGIFQSAGVVTEPDGAKWFDLVKVDDMPEGKS